MKKTIFKSAAVLVLTITLVSFTSLSEKKIKTEDSSVTWKGHKVTGSHEGNINLSEGTLLFEGETLTGGNIVIDMSSISVTDLETGDGKEKLEGHLNSDDFFGTTNHKTASFKMTKVTGKAGNYKVTGDMTIKGVTHPLSFDMMVNNNTATANLKVDRTKYDIRYGSASFFDNLKDKAIYDEFDLMVSLKF
jgi:polyisoprenoid-binding protein YceI